MCKGSVQIGRYKCVACFAYDDPLGEGSLKVVFSSNEGFFLESTTFIQFRAKTFNYRKFKNVMIYCLLTESHHLVAGVPGGADGVSQG